jgi:hypothetical protein
MACTAPLEAWGSLRWWPVVDQLSAPESMVDQYKLTEAEPPREPRPPKTAPRLRDGGLMLFTPALIRAPVHASRPVRKLET